MHKIRQSICPTTDEATPKRAGSIKSWVTHLNVDKKLNQPAKSELYPKSSEMGSSGIRIVFSCTNK